MFGTMGWLRPSPAMVVAVIALAAALAGVAYATIPNEDGSVSGCYQTKTGILRVVDVGAGGECTREENAIRLASVDGAGRVADANKLGGAAPSAYVKGADTIASGDLAGSPYSAPVIAAGKVTNGKLRNPALTVLGVGGLGGGGPVSLGGTTTIHADMHQVQHRVNGFCLETRAVKRIHVNGAVDCSDPLATGGHIHMSPYVQVPEGSQKTLISSRDISVIGRCTDDGVPREAPDAPVDPNPPFARLEVSGANRVYASISNAGFQTRWSDSRQGETFQIAGTSFANRGDFNLFNYAGGDQLDGSFTAYVDVGSSCYFEASGISSTR